MQHFQPINFFGGEEKFIDNIKRIIKNTNYAKKIT
jgi:hypothetical protein